MDNQAPSVTGSFTWCWTPQCVNNYYIVISADSSLLFWVLLSFQISFHILNVRSVMQTPSSDKLILPEANIFNENSVISIRERMTEKRDCLQLLYIFMYKMVGFIMRFHMCLSCTIYIVTPIPPLVLSWFHVMYIYAYEYIFQYRFYIKLICVHYFIFHLSVNRYLAWFYNSTIDHIASMDMDEQVFL